MPGIAWDEDRHESFVRDLAPFLTEFTPPQMFFWGNSMYGPVESEILYGLVRRYKPNCIVELGSGFTSLIIAAACRRNAREGRRCRYVAFDPFPREFVKTGIDGLDSLAAVGATEVQQGEFEALGDGDLLFIDTTHTVKVGGDVNRMMLEVLPTLTPGVLVHVHDVFLPYEYPRAFFEKQLYWQEQYLLQALLAENPKFEVLFPAYAVSHERPDLIEALIPWHKRPFGPGAFWIRRTAPVRPDDG
jgi:predicted O-methyltransferase YrrM